MSEGLAPSSISDEALRITLASVLSNLNQPVSVEIAINSASAIAGVIFQPADLNRSNTISPVAAAVESITSTVPRLSPVTWWSMTSTGTFEVLSHLSN